MFYFEAVSFRKHGQDENLMIEEFREAEEEDFKKEVEEGYRLL